ncbi:MAG: glycosyltransferase family 9 protein, partial [Streptomyces sp.]|nr:glycosyltransferase family 9 protein [Streptomyces sp.]
WHPGPDGDPHAPHPDPALLRIPPDDVLAALDRATATASAPRTLDRQPS